MRSERRCCVLDIVGYINRNKHKPTEMLECTESNYYKKDYFVNEFFYALKGNQKDKTEFHHLILRAFSIACAFYHSFSFFSYPSLIIEL